MKIVNYAARMRQLVNEFEEFCKDEEVFPQGEDDLGAEEWDEQFLAYMQTHGVKDDV